MAHRLVAVTQPLAAFDHGTIKDDRVLTRHTAEGQTIGLHGFHIGAAAEGAAIAKFPRKRTVAHVQRAALTANRGFVKINVELDDQTVARHQGGGCPLMADSDRFHHLHRGDRRAQTLDALLHDAAHEMRRRAIHDRNFRTVDFDQGVVDATARQCGHDVFNGRHRGTRGVHQTGAQRGTLHQIPTGGNQCVAKRNIGAAETDTVIGRCRLQNHADRFAGVQSDPVKCH
mmetsp:Transcript_3600/g.4001  ORF Transcript_3600/g.4001 Transcript_3600/m.4001 type:complete len:229 (-) Transcript_3600:54-740(-)